jgi:uncharacterized cupin superfamily protein
MMSKKKPSAEEIKQMEQWGTWQKEPSVFPWYYDERETCYILQGHATVVAGTGESIEFEAGDMVVFEPGLECTWTIREKIVKRYNFG